MDRRNFGRRDFGRRSFGGGYGGRREMHRAVCSSCGKDCEVPFEPTGSKPVYCNECFRNNGGGSDSRRFGDRGPRRDFERRSDSRPQNNEQFEAINRKLDKILAILAVPQPKKEKEIKIVGPQKKTKISKKKTPITKE